MTRYDELLFRLSKNQVYLLSFYDCIFSTKHYATLLFKINFRNAGIDPWDAGGVTNSTPGISGEQSRGIYNYFYEGSAHHLDLRQPNTCDPQNVHNLRFQIVEIFKCWLDPTSPDCPFVQRPLPDFEFSKSSECKYIYQGYPWNQTFS